MKIAFFSPANVPSKSAVSIFTMKLSEALVDVGHDVLLVVQGIEPCDGDLESANEYYGVSNAFRIRRLPRLLNLPGRRFINGAIGAYWAHRWKASMVYGRNVYACYWAAIFGLRTTFEAHSPMYDGGKVADIVFRRLIRNRNFDKLIVITDSLKEHFMGEYEISADHVCVIPDAASEPGPGDTLSLDSSRLQVGYIGQLYPGKGAEIISALAGRLEWADFHCVGGLEQDISHWRKQTENLTNIKFYGHIPYGKIDRYRRSFDVMLAPYLQEVHGFDGGKSNLAEWMSPLKLFEYMAAGKPIVCSDLPVLREVVSDQETALMCPADDLDCWESALVRLRDDEGLRQRLADAAKEKYRDQYSWRSRASKLVASVGAR